MTTLDPLKIVGWRNAEGRYRQTVIPDRWECQIRRSPAHTWHGFVRSKWFHTEEAVIARLDEALALVRREGPAPGEWIYTDD